MLDEKMDIYKCPKVEDALSKKPQKTKLQHNAVKNKNQLKNMTACFCKEKTGAFSASFWHPLVIIME
jgi:hypothetical protein